MPLHSFPVFPMCREKIVDGVVFRNCAVPYEKYSDLPGCFAEKKLVGMKVIVHSYLRIRNVYFLQLVSTEYCYCTTPACNRDCPCVYGGVAGITASKMFVVLLVAWSVMIGTKM